MKLQAHPKQGDTIKGYTVKGYNKRSIMFGKATIYYILLENKQGVRRKLEYIPRKKDVGSFEQHVENGHASYYVEWFDYELNLVSID